MNNIVKTLKQKANEDEVKKEFYQLKAQLSQFSDALLFYKKDGENQKLFLAKFINSQQMGSTQPLHKSLIMTKQIYPGKCLSCGKNTAHSSHVVQQQHTMGVRTVPRAEYDG